MHSYIHISIDKHKWFDNKTVKQILDILIDNTLTYKYIINTHLTVYL